MGTIFDLQRCSYHDGPGIRTTVFFKGCPLRCAWCHNPESFSSRPQLQFVSHACLGCEACARVCPNGVHRFADGRHLVDFQKCTACGACAGVCPTDALTILGREASVEEIMATVLRDRAYYEASGGGLTVSGGEPTMQPGFLAELLRSAKAQGIHTALETNGYIPGAVLAQLLDLVDLFLLDFKLTEAEGLTAYTGAAGSLWENTMATLTQAGKPVILRMPVIPGINDTPQHFREAAAFKRSHPNVEKIEIMAYHAIGAAKWEQLGLPYTLGDLKTVGPEQKALWQSWLDEAL